MTLKSQWHAIAEDHRKEYPSSVADLPVAAGQEGAPRPRVQVADFWEGVALHLQGAIARNDEQRIWRRRAVLCLERFAETVRKEDLERSCGVVK